MIALSELSTMLDKVVIDETKPQTSTLTLEQRKSLSLCPPIIPAKVFATASDVLPTKVEVKAPVEIKPAVTPTAPKVEYLLAPPTAPAVEVTATVTNQRHPASEAVMTAITTKLSSLDELGFTEAYKRFERSLTKGAMDYAKILNLNTPAEFIRLIASLNELVAERDFTDRRVYQFKLPANYRAYSPWIHADDLHKRRRELPFDPFKSLQPIYKLHPHGKSGYVVLESRDIKPMLTNIITFIIMKESGLVRWFAGDEPAISQAGPSDWVHLMAYSQPKFHKRNEPYNTKPDAAGSNPVSAPESEALQQLTVVE